MALEAAIFDDLMLADAVTVETHKKMGVHSLVPSGPFDE